MRVCSSEKMIPLQNELFQYFSVSLKFGACYITGQWGEFRIKNAFWHFVLFHHKICVFIIFISFLDEVYKIPTNQKQELVVQNCVERICSNEIILTAEAKLVKTTLKLVKYSGLKSLKYYSKQPSLPSIIASQNLWFNSFVKIYNSCFS